MCLLSENIEHDSRDPCSFLSSYDTLLSLSSPVHLLLLHSSTTQYKAYVFYVAAAQKEKNKPGGPDFTLLTSGNGMNTNSEPQLNLTIVNLNQIQ